MQSSGGRGVIFMSLGTLTGELYPDLTEGIAAAFAKLLQKVIWRYKVDRPGSLSNNALLVDWIHIFFQGLTKSCLSSHAG